MLWVELALEEWQNYESLEYLSEGSDGRVFVAYYAPEKEYRIIKVLQSITAFCFSLARSIAQSPLCVWFV